MLTCASQCHSDLYTCGNISTPDTDFPNLLIRIPYPTGFGLTITRRSV